MASPEDKSNIGNQEDFFDKVVIQILVPHYAGLNQICFHGREQNGKGPIRRGRSFEPGQELNRLEINKGTILLSLVLN